MSNLVPQSYGVLSLGCSNPQPTYCGGCSTPLATPTAPCHVCNPAAPVVVTEKCYAAAIPPQYANLYLDVAYDGAARVEQVILRARPNGHTFNLTTDVLPFGWTFDAINGVLYYPQGFAPTGKFAVWTAPGEMDACGAYVWLAQEICLRIEEGDCASMTAMRMTAQTQYFCLAAKVVTTLAQALTDLRAAFGQGVQVSKDGGLVENSLFQLAANSQPVAFAGSANLAGSVWSLGRCDASGFSLTAAQLCNAVGNIPVVAAVPLNAEVVLTSPTGCARVLLADIQHIVPIKTCTGAILDVDVDRVVTCAQFSGLATSFLASLAAGATLTSATKLVGTDGKFYTLPASSIAPLIRCSGTPLNPLVDRVVTCDEIGTAITGLPAGTLNETRALYFVQADGGGGVQLATVAPHDSACAYPGAGSATVLTPLGWGKSEAKLNSVTLVAGTHSLDPAVHEVVYLNAASGNVILNLVAPSGCQRNHFWIKRTDNHPTNTVKVRFAAGIDGEAEIELLNNNLFIPNRQGEAIHIHFAGPGYSVI